MGEIRASVSVNGGPEHNPDTPEGRAAIQSEVSNMINKEEDRVEAARAEKPSLPGIDDTAEVGGVQGKRLKTYIDRIERLDEEKSGLADDIKDIYAESKAFGYDVKTLRQIIRLRKIDEQKRREADELLEVYKAAIGME